MSVRYSLLLCCALLVAACSDDQLSSPQIQKPQTVALPSATPSAAPAVPSPDDHTARFEFYSRGQLKQVFRGTDATSPSNFDEFTSADFRGLVAMMDKRPANDRTARVANLLRGLDRIPVNVRAGVFEARAKQLTKETVHNITTLSDGTRIFEYYFDGQLAGRAVVPAASAAAASKPAHSVELQGGPVARDIATGDDCADCWTDADEVYYWGIITYVLDQGAELDYEANDLVFAAPAAALDISMGSNCLKQYFDYLQASGEFLALGATLGLNWDNATNLLSTLGSQGVRMVKIGIVSGAIGKLNKMWTTWNAFHDCVWAWKG